jgi:hypothetical protein
MSEDFDPATLSSNDNDFWLNAGQPSLDPIWDNSEDDIYAELLEPDNCRRNP